LPIDFLHRAVLLYPDNIAIESATRQITYRELGAAVRALACALQTVDPEPGSRVAMCAANAPEYIVGMMAILAAGKVWVPLNYRSTTSELARILDVTAPISILVDDAGSTLIPDGKGQKINFSEFQALASTYRDQQPVAHARDRDDTQAIKFTGGTTGLPKGVMQPCTAWMANIINQIGGWDITADDKVVLCAPISHGTGTYILPLLAQGATLVLCPSNKAADI